MSQLEAIFNSTSRMESLLLSLMDGLITDRSKYVEEEAADLSGAAINTLSIERKETNPFLLKSVFVACTPANGVNIALRLGQRTFPLNTTFTLFPQGDWNIILDPADIRQLTADGAGMTNARVMLVGTSIPMRGTIK